MRGYIQVVHNFKKRYMSKDLPYMPSAGTLPKVLDKIIEASVPESFNYDFLGTKLGFKGGNQRTFVSWAKKCDFLTSDGTPTSIYKNLDITDRIVPGKTVLWCQV